MAASQMIQSEYAEYQNVSRKTVTIWKQKGLVVLTVAGLVDVAATDRKLRGHFGVLPRNKNRQPS